MTLDQLWFSLSFLFVDNEVDYKKIAKEISNYDIKVIEFQLFYNVAPICSENLEQTISPIWSSFDKEELIKDIQKHAMDEKDITWRKKLSANLYKFKYRKEWECLKKYLNQN
ncbi:hypothetical protein [Acinetobacter sp. RF14B]|uniref:DUF7079 family protein n=1 Tax=Acinetobacter sp. RF14B TaxID=2650965 RepID=UPI0011713D2D|nr:hypothetical protein [Acinetobacter sp. RF14B]TQR64451.1 hypothetical protein E2K52_06960 [Acinetobacter sp. RF14B]